MIKYIVYCRKSTDEKEKQILSIESQLQELKEFAKKENLQIVETITESKSAKNSLSVSPAKRVEVSTHLGGQAGRVRQSRSLTIA